LLLNTKKQVVGIKGGKGDKQKSLEKWGKEKWQTREEYEKTQRGLSLQLKNIRILK